MNPVSLPGSIFIPFVALAVEFESHHRMKSVFEESASSKNPTALAGLVMVVTEEIEPCEKLPLRLTGPATVTIPVTGTGLAAETGSNNPPTIIPISVEDVGAVAPFIPTLGLDPEGGLGQVNTPKSVAIS
jgi:hypothetical protein